MNHVFHDVFGIREKLTNDSAMRIYDAIDEKLRSQEFLPREMFDRFDIEILTTTDSPTDTLEHHAAIRDSGWRGRIVPCFRPDNVVKLDVTLRITGAVSVA